MPAFGFDQQDLSRARDFLPQRSTSASDEPTAELVASAINVERQSHINDVTDDELRVAHAPLCDPEMRHRGGGQRRGRGPSIAQHAAIAAHPSRRPGEPSDKTWSGYAADLEHLLGSLAAPTCSGTCFAPTWSSKCSTSQPRRTTTASLRKRGLRAPEHAGGRGDDPPGP
jgi:hypothetical protein